MAMGVANRLAATRVPRCEPSDTCLLNAIIPLKTPPSFQISRVFQLGDKKQGPLAVSRDQTFDLSPNSLSPRDRLLTCPQIPGPPKGPASDLSPNPRPKRPT